MRQSKAKPASAPCPPYSSLAFLCVLCASAVIPASAQVYNLRVVTDANPDYCDLPSLVRSATSRFETPAEKCWAMFYWNHIARRQTNPIVLHGTAHTDPIRQFNDYGYTMCSTISGINQSVWEEMGLKHRYWDIGNHTVGEVFYDGAWHMYDNSMSAIYTTCDGRTIAGVEQIGAAGACELSHGKSELGHIAKYHCLTATSANGFLTGADTIRSLDEEARCFNPNGLKLRTYFYDWERGHRYILNLRPGEVYTRAYRSLGDKADFFVPDDNGKDPELVNPRYKLRGNGEWRFHPNLKDAKELERVAYFLDKVVVREAGGVTTAPGAENGVVVFKLSSANVGTGLEMTLVLEGSDIVKYEVSRDNGLHWARVTVEPSPPFATKVFADKEVNGTYEVLVRFTLGRGTVVTDLKFLATTALNSKTQPRLNVGRNTVHVSAGEQTDSIVLWPELQGDKYKETIVDERNVASAKKHSGYMAALHPAVAKEDAYVTYRVDAPRDLTAITYGGRFYNRAPKSRVELRHSFDGGKTWATAWTLTDTRQPWDVIHFETAAAPAGCKSVLLRYVMNSTEATQAGCGIYSLRIEARHRPIAAAGAGPVEVTFAWNEVRADRSLVKRSHTQVVDELPATYTINVGGADHPVMESLTTNLAGARADAKAGYSDGKDAGGGRWTPTWQTVGTNLAVGKPYSLSTPSDTTWDAGDPDGTKLTDGVAGPPESGGASYRSGAIWAPKRNPVITLDLGAVQPCAALGLNFHGYPAQDALKGQIKDTVEVLVSEDGKAFTSVGTLKTDVRRKDVPVNHMVPDDEAMTGGTFRLVPARPVAARFVQFKVTSDRHFCATEVEVLDAIRSGPFDMRVALPEK